MRMVLSRLSPTPSSSSSDGSARDVAAAATSSTVASGSGSGGPSTRNFKASQAASIAAVVESTSAHRNVIPGLAELMGGSSVVGMMSNIPYFKSGGSGGGGSSSSEVLNTRIMNANASNSSGGVGGDGDNSGNAMDLETTAAGHPSLPSTEAVSTASSRLIDECPPFMTMSARDSAPQLQLEDPPPVVIGESGSVSKKSSANQESSKEDKKDEKSTSSANFQRRLVVRGGMKGYRMSRATHGATSGCYYYEAVVLGSSENDVSSGSRFFSEQGVKRSLQEMQGTTTAKEKEQNAVFSSGNNGGPAMRSKREINGRKGHIRMGWSTRNADLQAPVGYNEHSYAIRDIMGSRIHKSRREDKWGGVGFGPGDVLGMAIFLAKNKTPSNTTTPSTSLGNAPVRIESAKNIKESSRDSGNTRLKKSPPTLTNHICFFKNGELMGNGIAFDNINPGTYYPSVSCYMDGSARLNFGPHFIYPPKDPPTEINLHPISELCKPPPLPDEVMEKVMTGGSSKEGKKTFFSKRSNDSIVSAYKELVKMEATERYEAYLKHLDLHRREIIALRNERGLTTLDLVDNMQR